MFVFQEQPDGKKEEKAVNDVRLHAEEHEPKKDAVTSPTDSPKFGKPAATKPKGVKCGSTFL